MGKRGKVGIVQRRVSRPLVLAGLVAAWAVAGGVFAQSDNQESAFKYEERSTIHTIQLNSMEEETLANTVIEGGLTAPAAGVPLKPRVEDDFYLDPLVFAPVTAALTLAAHRSRWSSVSAIQNPFPGRLTATTT